jgi:ankyrin repeat protein
MTASKQRTSIHLAAMSGSVQTAQLLEALYPNVNLRDADDRTPLHHAVLEGNLNMTTYLVTQRGASVAAQVGDSGLQVPIHEAAVPLKSHACEQDNRGQLAMDLARDQVRTLLILKLSGTTY